MTAAQPRAHHPFRVEVSPDRPRAIVTPHGELDLATVDPLETAVAELRARDFATIVLDLRDLTFIDSTGLRLLLRIDASARADGWSFAIVDGDGPVRHLLELTGLTDRFQHGRAPSSGSDASCSHSSGSRPSGPLAMR